jgi:hypothetical protein
VKNSDDWFCLCQQPRKQEIMSIGAASAGDAEPGRPPPTWSALVGFGLASRVIVVLLGCSLALSENSINSRAVNSPHNHRMNPRHRAALTLGTRPLILPWYRWEPMCCADVAERGYPRNGDG